jgi:hypothetical protein
MEEYEEEFGCETPIFNDCFIEPPEPSFNWW